jgi:hypothetical protein
MDIGSPSSSKGDKGDKGDKEKAKRGYRACVSGIPFLTLTSAVMTYPDLWLTDFNSWHAARKRRNATSAISMPLPARPVRDASGNPGNASLPLPGVVETMLGARPSLWAWIWAMLKKGGK